MHLLLDFFYLFAIQEENPLLCASFGHIDTHFIQFVHVDGATGRVDAVQKLHVGRVLRRFAVDMHLTVNHLQAVAEDQRSGSWRSAGQGSLLRACRDSDGKASGICRLQPGAKYSLSRLGS